MKTTFPLGEPEVTPKAMHDEYRSDRRGFLRRMGLVGAGAAISGVLPAAAFADTEKLKVVDNPAYKVDLATTPQQVATHYNNFYEFGTSKTDPAANAHTLQTRPWGISVEGLVKKPQTISIDTLLNYKPLEQRVYRFRCVEAWSMVIPWDGYPLSEFIKAVNPLPSAKYVQFVSVANPKQEPLPDVLAWPYVEGLRMDEAMNPLTLLTFGSYGEALANQQGAPVRVMVPWKYGYKSPKSIVKIRFVAEQPPTSWNIADGQEYGFYSNVNPNYDNARWSQARERLLNSNSIFPKYVPTQMFNGYEAQVAGMYAGMDLKKNY